VVHWQLNSAIPVEFRIYWRLVVWIQFELFPLCRMLEIKEQRLILRSMEPNLWHWYRSKAILLCHLCWYRKCWSKSLETYCWLTSIWGASWLVPEPSMLLRVSVVPKVYVWVSVYKTTSISFKWRTLGCSVKVVSVIQKSDKLNQASWTYYEWVLLIQKESIWLSG